MIPSTSAAVPKAGLVPPMVTSDMAGEFGMITGRDTTQTWQCTRQIRVEKTLSERTQTTCPIEACYRTVRGIDWRPLTDPKRYQESDGYMLLHYAAHT